jgi:amino acid adenylation domain-containing protein
MSDLAARIAGLPPEQRHRILQELEARNGQARASDIVRLPRGRDGFPLSFAQERLWFLEQLTPGSALYNLASAQNVPFAVDRLSLERALSELARRHEALRTVFPVVDGEPVQRILTPATVRCSFFDLESVSRERRDEEVRRLAAAAAQSPFDLSTGPLFRVTLIRVGPFESAFVLVIHHIVADGWSLQILFRELAALYADAVEGRPCSLPEPPLQYVDYSVWQRKWLSGSELERRLDYWRSQLAGLPLLNLATDRPRPRLQSFRGAQLEVVISAVILERVRALARETEATPFMVLLTAFFALLHAYTGQDDFAVGTPTASRPRPELEGVVGFFANSLVLRADLRGQPTFLELVKRVREMALEAYSHEEVPFSKLVEALRPDQDLSRNPLFQVSFQLIAAATGARKSEREQRPRMAAPERGAAIFDLVLNLWEEGDEVRGLFEFNTDLFDRATIERMAGHYRRLLEAASRNPESRVGRLPILGEVERRQLLVEWNATDRELPEVSLGVLFERQVAKTPRAVALRSAGAEITYEELNRAAERVAARLQELGVGPRRCVGMLAPASPELVAAILGVLKTGNAYVPFDPSSPAVRTAAMVHDASVEWVLTSDPLAPVLTEKGVRAIPIDEGGTRPSGDARFHAVEVEPCDLAYVIFTSGSTGRPKGTMITHRGVVNYLTWCRRTYPVDAGVGAPLCSPISSDMSVTSLFLPLITGKTVTLLPEGDVVESLDAALRGGPRFSFVKLTPSHLEALRSLAVGRDAPANTAAFIVGGEPLLGDTLDPWRRSAPDIAVYNEYGPTETVVGCCVHYLRASEVGPGPVPIGRPIDNTRLYVLDRFGAPVPVGVPGELYIGGAGVALGYVNEPGLTTERFVADPFCGEEGQTLYRTGDLARYGADGTLHFMGRLDGQIKIRGHRIEPGEIEAALRQHPGVAEAAVVATEHGQPDRRLLACIVPSGRADAHVDLADELRLFLREKLPPFMVPSAFLLLDAIPLTRTGKVDVRAAQGLGQRNARPTERVPPTSALEEVIAGVFRDVLKTQDFGVRHDFFTELGGHSLLATSAIARIRELLQADVPVRALFETPTVEGLARRLRADRESGPAIEETAALLMHVLHMSDEQVSRELATAGPSTGSHDPSPEPGAPGEGKGPSCE